MNMEKEHKEEEKKEKVPKQAAEDTSIELVPTGYTYNIVVDGNVVNVERLEDAMILTKLEKMDKQMKELSEK